MPSICCNSRDTETVLNLYSTVDVSVQVERRLIQGLLNFILKVNFIVSSALEHMRNTIIINFVIYIFASPLFFIQVRS